MKAKIALLGILFLLASGTAGLSNDKVRLTNGEWPPYTSQQLPNYGIMSKIITEAFALTGIKVEYTFFDSWKRCYVLAQKGRFDGSLGWTYTKKREKDFYFSDPVIAHKNVLFHLKSTPFDWELFTDLKDLRISVTNAYFYGDGFDNALDRGQITAFIVYKDIIHFRNLLQNRTDIFPMDDKVGDYLLRSEFSPKEQKLITHHPKPVGEFATGLVISKQIDKDRAIHLIKAFNKGLAHLKQTGKYQKLIVQHTP